jgi:uncharacterized protein involved in exopolysaccharide biosynthesis
LTAPPSGGQEPGITIIIDLQSVVSELPPDPVAVETELDVIRSDFHAQPVIEELGLLSDAEFNPLMQPKDIQPSRLAGLTELGNAALADHGR